MSRLYDALKEANRVRQGLGRNGKPGLWEAWGIKQIDIPPLQTAPEVVAPAAPDTDAPADPASDGYTPAVELPLPPATVRASSSNGSLGTLTAAAMNLKERLIPHAIDGSVVEHYRRLRTKILQKREEKPFRSLLVTSANPQEGKTVTVMNLGLSFSMLPDFKVLVVDGDLRRGSLGNWLGVAHDHPGLSNLVDGSAQLGDVVLKSEAVPMHFMVRGNSRVTDMHPAQFEVHFRRLAEYFDLIIVDSPPVNLLADVQLLAGCCEAVLLVARSFVTSRQALEKAAQELDHFRVIGTVLNASASTQRSRYYYGYY